MIRNISDVISDSYKIAIPYVNDRVIPSFYDGLKNSQRRTIFSMINIASKNKVKVASIAGDCIAHYHPHGDQSIVDVVIDLVTKGILEGQGNFGMKYLYNHDTGAAAPRYIEAGLSKSFNELVCKLLPYCPMEKSDIDASKMPKRLILPLPIAAITGSRGIGLAANTNIPAFTPTSLLDAMKNDDPNLLRSTYGATIVPEKSALNKLWTKGHGKITFRMNVYEGEYQGIKGTFMEGNPWLFGKINLSGFKKAINEGLVVIYDIGDKIFIGKQYNVRKINTQWIFNQCKKVSEYSDVYMISVNKDGVIGRTSLRYWIKSVYEEYINYYNKYILDQISQKESAIKTLKYLKPIGEMLIKGCSDDEILKAIPEINKRVLDDASSKSINMLRKDHKSTINKLKSEIESFKSIKVGEMVDTLISKL